MWVYFIAGQGNKGVVAVAIGMSREPEAEIARMEGLMPFKLELLGVEEGGQERLEALRKRFSKVHLHGPWYRPNKDLEGYLAALAPVSRTSLTKRVSLDLAISDYVQLDEAVKQRGVTKSHFLRTAVQFFLDITSYEARGYLIQAIKDGDLVQFRNLVKTKAPKP